eukprot:Skav234350  [mRNA]  locus=scaffold1274:72879:75718:+ [translate_table: standard]
MPEVRCTPCTDPAKMRNTRPCVEALTTQRERERDHVLHLPLIVLKFVVQDFPQQMCIAAYLYAWYADNGLRCQMCLFHPSHCDEQYPLHLTNLLVCLFTLLSAVANQLLLQAKLKRGYDSEDECVLCFFRFVMVSVSILPFSTAMCFLSAVLLHLKSVAIYFMSAIPTILGWGTLLCAHGSVPLFVCCDEEF